MRMYILVEGDTEEKFVKSILYSEFMEKGIFLQPVKYETKRKKSGEKFSGGGISFPKLEKQIKTLLKSGKVTTMIDYYGLNDDFPGYKESLRLKTSEEKAVCIENKLKEHVGNTNFIPYIQMHEFEALLLSDANAFYEICSYEEKINELTKQIAYFSSPEEVNNSVETAPSKRIASIFIGYKKTVDGIIIAEKIGIKNMMQKCKHFNNWINQIVKIK